MKETPILFSGPMVTAILSGRKTQTRRVMLPQPDLGDTALRTGMGKITPHPFAEGWLLERWEKQERSFSNFGRCEILKIACPYGKPGDRLWVREKWASPEKDKSKPGRIAYDADGVCGCWIGHGEDRHFICHGRVLHASGFHENFPAEGSTTRGLGQYSDIRSGEYPSYKFGWRPSIHMPRWASRITLEIVSVRVERVKDISRGDAMEEGCPFPNMADGENPVEWFGGVWRSINGIGSWNANPWVWVIEFKQIQAGSPEPTELT